VCLPGRESRFLEPLVDDWKSLVKDFCQDVHGILRGKPFAFWGHSLGAGICFEVARHLKLHYDIQPVHMLISSSSAPQVPRTVLDVSSLSDDDLIQKIRQWGGTPKALTENQEMMKIAARVLRADLTILQNYRFKGNDNVVLNCPVTCFYGSTDQHDQDSWTELIHGPLKRHVLPGGHFYFMEGDNESSLTNLVSAALGFNSTL